MEISGTSSRSSLDTLIIQNLSTAMNQMENDQETAAKEAADQAEQDANS